jgi:hypothetical protein
MIFVFRFSRVFEYAALVRICPYKQEHVGRWRNLHSEELKNVDTSSGFLRVIKERQM